MSGYMWEVMGDERGGGGCKLGKGGVKIVWNGMRRSKWLGGNYLYMGRVCEWEGIGLVDLCISGYGERVDRLKMGVVGGVGSIG